MSHHLCLSCKEHPENALKGSQNDCLECALHTQGPNTTAPKKPRKYLEEAFDRTWYSSSNPITNTEQHLRTRLAWLGLLYASGWFETEFEEDQITLRYDTAKPHQAVGRRAKRNK